MMYYYWKTKGIRPSVLYTMPRGELTVVQAFYERELEERNAHNNLIKGKSVMPVIMFE